MTADAARSLVALTATIDALQRELDGLRRANRLRAIIEQAKGVLVERDGLTLDEAFARLRSLSQSQNARLVDVAATVVGVSLPEQDALDIDETVLPERLHPTAAMSDAWRQVREHPKARTGAVDAAVSAIADSSTDGDDAARLLVDLLAPTGVAAALVFAVAEDAALMVLGQHGYPADTVSAWRRIPLTLDLPLTRAVNEGTPVFVGSRRELEHRFPNLTQQPTQHEALAVVPVWDGDERIGSVGYSWADETTFDDATRQRILSITRRAATLMVRNLRGDDPGADMLTNVLHVVGDPWLVLDPGQNATPDILVIDAVSPQVPGGDAVVGQRLLAAFPGVAADVTLLDDLRGLASKGGRLVRRSQSVGVTTAPWDQEPTTMRAVRAGRRVVVTWRADPSG